MARANVPEEPVNSASSASCESVSEEPGQPALPNFSPVAWDYPENGRLDLSTFIARFVLSMNCEHPIANPPIDNELICTACSPESAGEERVHNAKEPIKSVLPAFQHHDLFTVFPPRNPGCEKVCV